MGDRLGGGNEECQDPTCDDSSTAIKTHVLLQIKTKLNTTHGYSLSVICQADIRGHEAPHHQRH